MSEVWFDIYDERYIHNSNLKPLTEFTSNRRNTEFKDILSWNISQMITKTIPISKRIDINYAMKQGIPILCLSERQRKLTKNMIRIFQWKETHCRTNTSIRRNKPRRAGLWESQSGIWVGKSIIWVKSFEIEKLEQSSPFLTVPPEKVSKSL